MHYARLKLELHGALAGRNLKSAQAHPSVQDLQARLKAVKSHYLFDERDAEAHYLSERQKAKAAALQARLRGSPGNASIPSSTPTTPEPKGLPRQPQAKEVREDPDDFFASTGEDGGLLEILEPMPSTEVAETGVTVTVRDMPLPRGKFERTSKAFLQGAIDKLDSFAVTTYQCISGTSRAIRASLSVRWSSGKVSEWAMEDVACHDMTQAEQYIATVALHALTFPTFEGFSPARGNTQTFFRLLTPAFRDFWDELEAKRKTSDDATNRAVWSKLKKIVEARGDQGKVCLLVLHISGILLSCTDRRQGFANGNSKHQKLQFRERLPREGEFRANYAGFRDPAVVIIIQGYASQFGIQNLSSCIIL